MIINLTKNVATKSQVKEGVVDLKHEAKEALIEALSFDSLPTNDELMKRAEFIAELAIQNGLGGDDDDDPIPKQAMIDGAPFLMPYLIQELNQRLIEPMFSYRDRTLNHVGWISFNEDSV